ncbi:DUF4062 domain-containing protein [Acinetobacter sp. HY1485]|uniref:DUF4062 domain-containing protein n=1 Tax=Acinetobacter sp. HY1485 TaxID=2970918 RepID=UPI0022B94928|nr:DUF4062 domain-containing protein [Acinetobacter sp. HY1485]
MANQRYHIFISTSGQRMERDYAMVCQTLINMGHFISGVQQCHQSQATSIRRQIDISDYVVVLQGDSYGEEAPFGVSHVQLEYIYAMARQKPIFVICLNQLSLNQSVDQQEKLIAFQNSFKQDQTHVMRYLCVYELVKKLKHEFPIFIKDHPSMGWVKNQETADLQSQIFDLEKQIFCLEQYNKRPA